MSKTELFVRQQQGGMFAVVNESGTTGNIWWVDSGSSTGADAAGYGQNPDAPCLTLDYAIGLCTANNGDIIYVMPGHTETWTTTGAKVVLDVAGVKVIGLGQGVDRPTFSFGHTGTTWTWSAASCSIENLLFVTAVDSVVTLGTISGTDWAIKNCEERDTTNIEVINDWTVTGDRGLVDGYFKNGYTGGDANVAVFTFAGVDRCEIKNCRFITKVTTAVVNFTAACTAIEVHDCDFLVTSTTDVSKNVVDTGGGSSWAVWNVFDLGAGCSFSGGSGGAVVKDDVGALNTAMASYFTSVTAASYALTSASYATSTAMSTNTYYHTSSFTSWDTRWSTAFSQLMSEISST